MSVRHALLAVLGQSPSGAFAMRQEFERRTGGTWPLNMGQVSTTLDRLLRDGLVEPVDDDEDVRRYALTAAGQAELQVWWGGPVERTAPARDELTIKLALAVATPDVDVRAVVRAQRTETLRWLQSLTRLKASAPPGDLAWELVVERLLFAAESEIRWLDHVEARLVRAAPQGDAAVRAEQTTGVSVRSGR